MINNRQGGGRRRGRGGQRPQGMGGQPGNRQDNRQRGNAAQLLEKYKSMARDAQLAGDRVQTEYYLQFADHYFRVLSESRARFEDQRRQRDDDDEDGDDDEMMDAGEDQREERPERRERSDRGDRGDRPERAPRRRFERDERQDEDEPVRAREPRRAPNGGGDGLSIDILPPAIGRDEPIETSDDEDGDETPRPRRRRRTRAAEGEGDIDTAA